MAADLQKSAEIDVGLEMHEKHGHRGLLADGSESVGGHRWDPGNLAGMSFVAVNDAGNGEY